MLISYISSHKLHMMRYLRYDMNTQLNNHNKGASDNKKSARWRIQVEFYEFGLELQRERERERERECETSASLYFCLFWGHMDITTWMREG